MKTPVLEGCLYSEDGMAAICVRTPEGAVRSTGNGWLHIIKPGKFKPKPVRKRHTMKINWDILNQCYIDAYLEPLNQERCSTPPPFMTQQIDTLYAMETGWDGEAYTFPVRDSADKVVGISRRFPDSSKKMVKGSTVGIFIPRLNWENLETLFICEGISDTAAALDMGLKAIGRLSCGTGREHIIKFCAKKNPSQIVIVSDNDAPGIAGAKTLGLWISQGYRLFTIPMPDIKIIVPPGDVKDLRAWRAAGLDLKELMYIIENRFEFKNNKNSLDFQS